MAGRRTIRALEPKHRCHTNQTATMSLLVSSVQPAMSASTSLCIIFIIVLLPVAKAGSQNISTHHGGGSQCGDYINQVNGQIVST